ncbi:MAG: hypothetical protein Q9187_009245, partial [Circinaria calcarea]
KHDFDPNLGFARSIDGSALHVEATSDSGSIPAPSATNQAANTETQPSSKGNVFSNNPPRNAADQIYCAHPDCVSSSSTFPRKSDWSKHMDKHNRPYICLAPNCKGLLGFTYQGGLTRHQREVHRERDDPKAPSFLCPHQDCKRSTGLGFSRKDNFEEHLKRVHRTAESENGVDIDGRSGSEMPLQTTPPLSVQQTGEKAWEKPRFRQNVVLRATTENGKEGDKDLGNQAYPNIFPITSPPAANLPGSSTQKKRRVDWQNENGTEVIGAASTINADFGAEVKRLKCLLESRDMELKILTTEKDAQIQLLKGMLEKAYGERSETRLFEMRRN